MAQPDVTAADVLTTIEEFDRLGRAEFLTKYGYGEARSYFIKHDGRFYDSKAIVGVAHQVRHGHPLTPEDFSGGDATVAALLRRLGFLVSVPNPRWTWDEIVLACDLVREHDWRALDDNHSAVIELSNLLGRLPIHPPELRGPTFGTQAASRVRPSTLLHSTRTTEAQQPTATGTTQRCSKPSWRIPTEWLPPLPRCAW